MEALGKIALGFILTAITAPLIGFVFSELWEWFIVPTFNVEPLRIIEALGIILTVGFIRHKREKEDRTPKEVIEFYIYIVLYSLISWGICGVFSLFM